MKGLLTFLFVVVLGVATFGYFKGWFSVTSQPDSEGNPSFTLHTNPDKVEADLHVALAKSKELIVQAEDKIKELKDKSAKAKGDQKTKLDLSIADLESKREALKAQYDQINKPGAKASDAEKKALAKQIDDLDKAIEQAGKH
jgi:hypothetical protein